MFKKFVTCLAAALIFNQTSAIDLEYSKVKEAFPCVNDYETVKVLPQKFQGWYANAQPMEQLISQLKPKVIIELGAWLGVSTLHMANLLPSDGYVFTVDHWYKAPYDSNIPNYYQDFDVKNLYPQFLSNVIHCGLEKKIIPVFGDTSEALKQLKRSNIVPDLIYVDADHEESGVYRDLSNYYPLVKGHGIICGDDYYWNLSDSGYPVKKAVDRFAKENNLTVHTPNNWFWFLTENGN